MCGLEITHQEGVIAEIRAEAGDVLSRGHLCAKAFALKDVQEDADRVRRPLKRRGEGFVEIGWREALDEVADRLHAVRQRHGPDAIAVYRGNPDLHSYSAQLAGLELVEAIGTRAAFSTASMDHLPHVMAAYLMFGHQLLLTVPDLDRTEWLLIVGANPVVSNGSLMAAPGMGRRLRALRARGGRVIVVDPRRTETAALADEHHAIVPGTDAWLLLAMVHVLFEEQRVAPGRLAAFTDGIDQVREATRACTPELAASRTGIPADTIRRLARELAQARSAACYGRVGMCTQSFGALATWALQVLNVLTGNLDRAGGMMFTQPAVDLVRTAALLGQRGSYARYRSRVRGLPEFNGELPVAVLAEEIDTPGDDRIRALVTIAGNPVLSTPNGRRLERALAQLDCLVAIDFYVNETTRHAQIILPPPSPLERDHYDVVFRAFGVRNTARYSPALFEAPPGQLQDWQIYLELATRLNRRRGSIGGLAAACKSEALRLITPRRLLGALLRLGPYGSIVRPWRGLSLKRLAAAGRTVDLGPLRPALPRRLYTSRRQIDLAPSIYIDDIRRLLDQAESIDSRTELRLIGRRQVRTNNSWLHNSARLARVDEGCTLLMHPADAQRRDLADGDRVRVVSRVGSVEVPVQIDDRMRPGVVSLPHGWGHSRPETRLRVARLDPGASINDLTDDQRVDTVSGTSAFSGVSVTVVSAGVETPAPAHASLSRGLAKP